MATISGPRAFRSSARSDGDSDGDASDARDDDASDVDARARRARAALTRSLPRRDVRGHPFEAKNRSGAFFRYNMKSTRRPSGSLGDVRGRARLI